MISAFCPHLKQARLFLSAFFSALKHGKIRTETTDIKGKNRLLPVLRSRAKKAGKIDEIALNVSCQLKNTSPSAPSDSVSRLHPHSPILPPSVLLASTPSPSMSSAFLNFL